MALYLIDFHIIPCYNIYMEQRAKTFFYGTLAVLAFSLVLGACPADSGTSANNPPVPRLSLSGQVCTQDISLENISLETLMHNLISINNYNDSLNISDGGLGGTGQIKDGQLTYTIIGVPPLSPIGEGLNYLKEMYSSLTFSSEDVQAAVVALEITDSEDYSGLFKGLLTLNSSPVFSLSGISISIVINIKMVNYVYVDKDLNITADEGNFNYTDFVFPISLTTDKIDLSLGKGWNSLCSEITAQVNVPPELIPILMNLFMNPDTLDPDLLNPDLLSTLRPTGNLKMSDGDPGNLNWTLVSSQSYDDIEPQYPEYPDFE